MNIVAFVHKAVFLLQLLLHQSPRWWVVMNSWPAWWRLKKPTPFNNSIGTCFDCCNSRAVTRWLASRLLSALSSQLSLFQWTAVNKALDCRYYLEPEADKPHDHLGADLKPAVCAHQTLKLLGQADLLQDTQIVAQWRETHQLCVNDTAALRTTPSVGSQRMDAGGA